MLQAAYTAGHYAVRAACLHGAALLSKSQCGQAALLVQNWRCSEVGSLVALPRDSGLLWRTQEQMQGPAEEAASEYWPASGFPSSAEEGRQA